MCVAIFRVTFIVGHCLLLKYVWIHSTHNLQYLFKYL